MDDQGFEVAASVTAMVRRVGRSVADRDSDGWLDGDDVDWRLATVVSVTMLREVASASARLAMRDCGEGSVPGGEEALGVVRGALVAELVDRLCRNVVDAWPGLDG